MKRFEDSKAAKAATEAENQKNILVPR
jgi:hypothetical protein